MKRKLKLAGPSEQLDVIECEADGYDLRLKRHRGKPPYIEASGNESELILLEKNARVLAPGVEVNWR